MANFREYRFSLQVIVEEPFECSVAGLIQEALRGLTIATLVQGGEPREVVVEHATVEALHA